MCCQYVMGCSMCCQYVIGTVTGVSDTVATAVGVMPDTAVVGNVYARTRYRGRRLRHGCDGGRRHARHGHPPHSPRKLALGR